MTNKLYRYLLVVLVGVFAFPVMALSASAPADIARIKESGVLRVSVIDRDIFPFVFRDNTGNIDGVDIRLAKKIAAELGVDVRFINTEQSFNGVVQNVIQGRADIAISKISATLSRTENVSFSRPYLVLNQALLFNRIALIKGTETRPEKQFIRNLDAEVGVIRNSSYEEYLRKSFPSARSRQFENWAQAVDAVFSGSVDAIYRDDFEVKRVVYESSNGSLLAKSITLTDRKDEIAIAVGWQDQQLLAWINRFLSIHLPEPLNADQVLKHHASLLR